MHCGRAFLFRAARAMTLACAVAVFCALPLQAVSETSPKPSRDINAVLADHDDRLLKIRGVVGVYVGLSADGKTPCLTVMVSERRAAAEQPIPASIEGYPVVIEVTGELRPLRY